MENKYIVYKNDYNKLCNYGFNDVNLQLDSSVDDYISSNNILEQSGGLNLLDEISRDITYYLSDYLIFLPKYDDIFRHLKKKRKVENYKFFEKTINKKTYLIGYKEIYNKRGKCIIFAKKTDGKQNERKTDTANIDEMYSTSILYDNTFTKYYCISDELYNYIKKKNNILDIDATTYQNVNNIHMLSTSTDTDNIKLIYTRSKNVNIDIPKMDFYYNKINITELDKSNILDYENKKLYRYNVHTNNINEDTQNNYDFDNDSIYNLKDNIYEFNYHYYYEIINNNITLIEYNRYTTEKYKNTARVIYIILFLINIAIYAYLINYVIENKEKIKKSGKKVLLDFIKDIENYIK